MLQEHVDVCYVDWLISEMAPVLAPTDTCHRPPHPPVTADLFKRDGMAQGHVDISLDMAYSRQ